METAQNSTSSEQKSTECYFCKKVFEYEYLDNPFFRTPYYCSKECEEKSVEARKVKEQKKLKELIEEETKKSIYEESRKISRKIPKKYIDIETYKRELFDKAINGIKLKVNYKRSYGYNNLQVTYDFGKSLFLTGSVGRGKTVFIASVAKAYLKTGIPIKWISFPKFIMELQNMFRSSDDSPYDEAKKVAKYESMLFIDDLGAEKLTEFVSQIMYYIINEREQNMLPTIITSNYSLSEINQQIDARVSSRIAGMCEVLEFKGTDKRIAKQ